MNVECENENSILGNFRQFYEQFKTLVIAGGKKIIEITAFFLSRVKLGQALKNLQNNQARGRYYYTSYIVSFMIEVFYSSKNERM